MSNGERATGPRLQADLFGESERRVDAASLVCVAAGAAPLSTAQRAFNRLTEKIRLERDALEAWEAYSSRFQHRVAGELEPLEREIRAAQRRLVQRLDESLERTAPAERLGRKQQAKLRWLLLDVIDDLLQEGADAALEALYEKHGHVSHAELLRQERKAVEALLGEALGPQAPGPGLGSTHPPRRSGKAKAAGRAASDMAAAKEAGAPVREIYRKLASALHPDRESDAVERERKTRMMQRANEAYERDDLLELLALQVEAEQIDAAALSSLPEERLARYNKVLREQLQALEMRTRERASIFRIEFGLSAPRVAPRDVDRALDEKLVEARGVCETLERYAVALGDARLRRAFLDELPDPEQTEVPGLEDIAALAAMFGDAPRTWRPRRRRRR